MEIHPLIAEVPASWNYAGWLGCLGVTMWITLMGLKLSDRQRGEKQLPPNAQIHQAHEQLRGEFEKHTVDDKREHENIFKKVGGVERGVEERLNERLDKIETDSKDSRRRIHNDITTIVKDVSGLQTSSTMQNQQMMQMDGKINRILERLPAKS